MYSRKVIEQKLARFTARYGWTPVPHTISDVEEMNKYIKSLNTLSKDGKYYEFDTAKLTPKLARWIENERAMCAIDCDYYLTRYHYINADNQLMRFTFRSGQRIFFNVCAKLEEEEKSIEVQILKARQLGMSTLVEGMITHRALFVPGVKCSIASANDQKTYVMLGMLYTALEHLPWWLPPKQTKDRRSGQALLAWEQVGSSVVVQSGAMRGGIGQGTSPTTIHLSEVSEYTDPVAQIEEGLFRAVHPSPNIFMIFESTGNGNTGWWAEQWKNNKEFYYQGRARMLPLFLPWFLTPELYPTPTWLKTHQIPADWEPAEETIAMTAKSEAFVRNTPTLRDQLGADWTLPVNQQWFWEVEYQDAKRRRVDRSFLRHMPCDDFEALIGEHKSTYDIDTLSAIEQRRARGFSVYGILGEGIAEKHDPSPHMVDPMAAKIHVEWTTKREQRVEWFFIPLAITDPETMDPLKKLIIYEPPAPGNDYSIGVDTSMGLGQDRMVITVTRTGYDEFPDVQAAVFMADDIDSVEAYAFAAAIAAYYAQYMTDSQPKFIIEQRRKTGDSCQLQLQQMGFRRHHVFIMYDRKTNRPKTTANSRLGWFTNVWSRPMLLSSFKYAIDNGWYIVNSKWLLSELETNETREEDGRVRMDHRKGTHDDMIFSAAMSYFTMHDLDVMIERAKKKFSFTSDTDEELVIDYSPYRAQIRGTSEDEWAKFLGSHASYS